MARLSLGPGPCPLQCLWLALLRAPAHRTLLLSSCWRRTLLLLQSCWDRTLLLWLWQHKTLLLHLLCHRILMLSFCWHRKLAALRLWQGAQPCPCPCPLCSTVPHVSVTWRVSCHHRRVLQAWSSAVRRFCCLCVWNLDAIKPIQAMKLRFPKTGELPLLAHASRLWMACIKSFIARC